VTSLDIGRVGTSEVVVVPDVVSGAIGEGVDWVHEARLVRVAASIIPANRRFFIRKEYKIKYRYYIDFKKESKKVLRNSIRVILRSYKLIENFLLQILRFN
jgi:hypothetical protein